MLRLSPMPGAADIAGAGIRLEAVRKRVARTEQLLKDGAASKRSLEEAQADLALALWRLARAGDEPRSRLSEALMILKRLNVEDRLTPTQRGWIAAIEGELARLP